MSQDITYMKQALILAAKAAGKGEVPVGAIIVKEKKILARAYNLRESKHRPTAHAELLAIEAAARRMGSWRLSDTSLYVTLEPCMMCWGAILLARIPRIIYGAADPKAGVCGSTLALHQVKYSNHFPKVTSGVLDQECGKILSDFFKELRETKRKIKK